MDEPTSSASHGRASSLPAAFAQAWKRQQELDKGEGRAEDVLAAWERCEAFLQSTRSAFYSRNESLDDFNTSSLKYLLVSYYIAGALGQLPGLANRASNLKRAQEHFSSFLAELERHHGLSREDIQVWHRETPLPPSERRTEKVNHARRERELQQTLQELRKRRVFVDDEEEEHADEEVEREFWLKTIQLSALKAIHELEAIQQELPMAEQMAISEIALQLDAKRVQQERPRAVQEDNKLVGPGEGVMTSKPADRQRKQQEVFRPSWNQPTITVEESAAIEMRFAAKSSQPAEKEQDSEEDEQESDEAVRKAREWDDYKDTHPAGWGNRVNQG